LRETIKLHIELIHYPVIKYWPLQARCSSKATLRVYRACPKNAHFALIHENLEFPLRVHKLK